jgi:type VI protein secretion system component VasK
MSWLARFNRWAATPFRAARELFPFSHDGRQTLIYLMFSLSTGILTLIVWWAMDQLFNAHEWLLGKQLADKIAWALMISVAAYACFVSLRAISLGKDGLSVTGRDRPDDAPAAAQQVADSAQAKADDIKDAGQ